MKKAPLFMIALAVALSSPLALAGEKEREAQTFFEEGMKLMGKKRYAEACEKFALSQELDPGMGTQYRLAECYEKLGRFASAYEQYMAVADAAKEAKKQAREVVARKHAAALEARVAKLTIAIPPSVAALRGLEVRCDGAPVEKDRWGTPIFVDPGDHIVTVTAPEKKPWEGKVWAEEASKLLVSVAALEDVAPPPPKPRSVVPAIALGAAGGVGVVLGATFAGLRAANASNAQELHDKISGQGGDCVGGGAAPFTSDCRALSHATASGDNFGTASLVSFLVGGAAIAGMATYLLLPAPKPGRANDSAVLWSPVAGAGYGGVMARGTF